MNDIVKQHLHKLHATLNKEFNELVEIRNELIKKHQYEIAEDVFRIENNIHNLQSVICVNLKFLCRGKAMPDDKNYFLDGPVD